MATRINLTHDEKTRQLIQTSQLVNRLNQFANGEITIDRDRMKAIEILLRKTLPDLSSVTMSSDPENPLFPKEITIKLIKPDAASDT